MIYLCNHYYATGAQPQTRELVAHYMREWPYCSLLVNSLSRGSAPPHDILVRSRAMMVGLLPALAANLTTDEIRALEIYARTEPDLDAYLVQCRRHITFVNDIAALKQGTPTEPNVIVAYATLPNGPQAAVKYANTIADEMNLRYHRLQQLENDNSTSLCDKTLRFCSGNAMWSQICHRYNEPVDDHDTMFIPDGD